MHIFQMMAILKPCYGLREFVNNSITAMVTSRKIGTKCDFSLDASEDELREYQEKEEKLEWEADPRVFQVKLLTAHTQHNVSATGLTAL